MTLRVRSHPRASRRHFRLLVFAAARGAIMSALSLLVLGFAGVPAALAQAPSLRGADPDLLKVVILSRHGVRSPLVDPSDWSASQWPKWQCGERPCCPGYLTPQGAALARQMGEYYGATYRGLLAGSPAGSCPATSDLWFWADTDQRTLVTGQSLLLGMLPSGCNVQSYLHWHGKTAGVPEPEPAAGTCPKGKDDDRIFHPVTSDGACRLDADRAEKEMRRVAGQKFELLLARTAKALDTAQCTLRCCLHPTCQPSWWRACGLTQQPPACGLTDKPQDRIARLNRLPHDLKPGETPTHVQLAGPPRIASTFAELLLLEYGNGFKEKDPDKDKQFGFGRTSQQAMHEMFRAHTEAFNVEQRTGYVAAMQGSRLLTRILLALQGQGDGADGNAPQTAKFVAYVGHDTNISNIGALLDAHWTQRPYYQPDQTPPAGALIFELRKGRDGKSYVHAFYAAQSPDQMHKVDGTQLKPVPALKKPLLLGDFEKLVTGARRQISQACWN